MRQREFSSHGSAGRGKSFVDGGIAANSSSARSLLISGVVVNALTGDPVGRAQVDAGGTATTTREDGGFSVQVSGTVSVPLTLSADGFHPRRTQASAGSFERVTVDLLPSGSDFDLDFFDHVFRDLGGHHTRRWTEEPEFEIWTKIVECRHGELGDCSDLYVTEQESPGQFRQLAREVIAADTPKFTGGVLRGDLINSFAPTVGKLYHWREYLRRGKIPVVLLRGSDASFARPWPWNSGRMFSASIQMHVQHKAIPFVYSHELAHALGFFHPIGYENVPLPSVMRTYQDRPTRHDMLHGRILYRRPPGSRTPDDDPADFFANASQMQESGSPDPSSIRLIR